MATPEAKIKAKIRRRMEKLANESGLPLFWDTPPASEYGAGGRPDHTCRIGLVMFHIEAKAQNWGKPTKKQADFHTRLSEHGETTLVVAGEKGVDGLYEAVKQMILNTYTRENLEQHVKDAQNLLLVASRLAMEPPRKQMSLDIAPGSGTKAARATP